MVGRVSIHQLRRDGKGGLLVIGLFALKGKPSLPAPYSRGQPPKAPSPNGSWLESAKKGKMVRSPEGRSKGETRYFSHFPSPLASALGGPSGSCCFSCQLAPSWFLLPQMTRVPGLWTTSSSLCYSRLGLVIASCYVNLWVVTPCSSSTFQTRSHKNTGSLLLAGLWLIQWGKAWRLGHQL